MRWAIGTSAERANRAAHRAQGRGPAGSIPCPNTSRGMRQRNPRRAALAAPEHPHTAARRAMKAVRSMSVGVVPGPSLHQSRQSLRFVARLALSLRA